MIEMQSVRTSAEVEATAALAREIWTQHYVPIIGQAQTDHMLVAFQSAPAISRQLADGYEYYLVLDESVPAGYFALVPNPSEASAQLSKLYVRHERRKQGLGRVILSFVATRCAGLGIRELWLTVNRYNTGSIAFYQRMGFSIACAFKQDIGGGFVMDDYKMVKPLVAP